MNDETPEFSAQDLGRLAATVAKTELQGSALLLWISEWLKRRVPDKQDLERMIDALEEGYDDEWLDKTTPPAS